MKNDITTVRAPRKPASRRDVFVCFGSCIAMTVLAVAIGIIRTQQLADARVADKEEQAQQRQADRDADQRAETLRLSYSIAASDYRGCKRGNQKDERFLDYADAAVTRSAAATKATLESPSSSDDQKRTAVRNYAGAAAQANALHEALKPEKCGNPPIPPPTRGAPE